MFHILLFQPSYDPQPSYEPFSGYGAVPPTPIYNIQTGANGELYAEPDPSMSIHPSQGVDYHEAYTVDLSIPTEDVDYTDQVRISE